MYIDSMYVWKFIRSSCLEFFVQCKKLLLLTYITLPRVGSQTLPSCYKCQLVHISVVTNSAQPVLTCMSHMQFVVGSLGSSLYFTFRDIPILHHQYTQFSTIIGTTAVT